MIFRNLCLLSAATALMAACTNEPKKPVAVTAPTAAKAPAIMEPFKFHKLIEVAPGQDFDVVSWGRGSADKGSLLILHSDSAAKEFTTTTGDLDGPIVDVYNSDMDLDGNPEIIIQAKTPDTSKWVSVIAYEFNGNRANKLDFPRLTASQRKGYRGGDNFYISEGKLMRQFPIYDGNTKEAKVTGQKRLLEYGLHNNSFTVKQVSKDSIAVNDKQPVASTPVKQETKVKEKKSSENTSKSSSKKHHNTETKKKKKKKHHSE